MSSKDENYIYDMLTEEFTQDAYLVDKSRGFQLIGVRAAYIVERLTKVFGIIGTGWRFVHSPFVISNEKEVTTEVLLQYRVESGGTYPYIWDSGWRPVTDSSMSWSEPIFGVGGNQIGRGGVPMSDAQKSAVSNALGKAASRLGVGIQAYKGQLEYDGTTVSVKDESEGDKDDTASMIVTLMWSTALNDAEKYESLRGTNKVLDAYHKRLILIPLSEAITKGKLKSFVSDNLSALIGREIKKSASLSDLTVTEAIFLLGMVRMINSEDVTWKDAIEVAKNWDKKSTWAQLCPAPEMEEDK